MEDSVSTDGGGNGLGRFEKAFYFVFDYIHMTTKRDHEALGSQSLGTPEVGQQILAHLHVQLSGCFR